MPFLVFIMGGALAGLAGYHYFAAVPGVYKISRNYGYFGDLAFYGIICGLISQGNPLAAIPIALLFGGLSIGSRFVQGKLVWALVWTTPCWGFDDHSSRLSILLPVQDRMAKTAEERQMWEFLARSLDASTIFTFAALGELIGQRSGF